MITVEIIAVGKIKEKFFTDAVKEYEKRLGRYCKFKITELPDFSDGTNSITKEGDLILPKIKGLCVPLCIEGEQMSSEQLAKFITNKSTMGVSHITFIIGGTLGLTKEILDISNESICFSKMTFPHQLIRVFLLEQIFRAFKISKGETYHR